MRAALVLIACLLWTSPILAQSYAVIDSLGHVVNIVEWDGVTPWSPGSGLTVRLATNQDMIQPSPLTSAANQRNPIINKVTNAPTAQGNWNSIDTAFSGDLSKMALPIGHWIMGATTLGQPVGNYLYTEEAYPVNLYLYNNSGFNSSTSGAGPGRTNAVAFRAHGFQAGQGDLSLYNGTIYVAATRAGATSFLANPAGALFNGEVIAGASGVYLNLLEINANDNGYDAAGIGAVVNLKRTVGTGALSAWWAGFRAQAKGNVAADVAFSAVGPFNFGLDCTQMTLGMNGSCLSLAADQKIYLNADPTDSSGLGRYPKNVGNFYISYSSAQNSISLVADGVDTLDVRADKILLSKPIVAPLTTPATSSDVCDQGALRWDANFIYVCTAQNTWKRAALSAF